MPLLSPAQGNVCFASAFHGWCFSLSSYARVYTDRLAAQVVSRSQIASTPSILSRATTTSYSMSQTRARRRVPPRRIPHHARDAHWEVVTRANARALNSLTVRGRRFVDRAAAAPAQGVSGLPDAEKLAKRLWGDVWIDPRTRAFVRSAPAPLADEDDEDDEEDEEGAMGMSGGGGAPVPRTFVQLVLEPLYKIYAQVLGEEAGALARTCAELGIHVRMQAAARYGQLLHRGEGVQILIVPRHLDHRCGATSSTSTRARSCAS